MGARVRERLTVSKQATQKFDVERINLRKLNELEAWKKYQIKISNRFAALENLSDSEAWENTTENTKTSSKDSQRLY